MIWRTSLLLLLVGCGPQEEEVPVDLSTCQGGQTQVFVVNDMTFGRQDPPGVTVGFDLDGRISDDRDTEGCGKVDAVHPDGTPGIDSAFSLLVPILEATEAAAVEGLIADSIRSGELLLLFEMSGLDDPWSDDCIDVGVVRGEGSPMLGTDGNLLDHQTFERHTTIAPGTVSSATLTDGRVHATGLSMQLQLQVLDEYLDFTVFDGQIHAQLSEDGTATGYFSGGVPVAEILSEFDLGDIDIADLIADVVPATADLYNPDTGECDGISITFEFEGLPAYLFDE